VSLNSRFRIASFRQRRTAVLLVVPSSGAVIVEGGFRSPNRRKDRGPALAIGRCAHAIGWRPPLVVWHVSSGFWSETLLGQSPCPNDSIIVKARVGVTRSDCRGVGPVSWCSCGMEAGNITPAGSGLCERSISCRSVLGILPRVANGLPLW
jgi:hypothetical protein